ncbi:formylglycine-generating enzyme family protein [Qiania dongpingensis]|uniref:SUMF1/EgtB/PvdO family nonheme iron enzyme n=1 Tax=Qiania dongpingensis TaxID=2763669 RepID=A0A7G9G3B8_9FIRM|nr:SUMF1/EgtB/PvdO family nonheme iron enzyme [Qiania dongpingensis]QNM05300.1 SUMF1/EgtB/PvdO family nonheme iron enzyme [Qiania dongpingensis]
MKRLLTLALSLLLVFMLAACGQAETDHTENTLAEIPEQFILIEGGAFLMGSPESEAWRGEDEAQHEVAVSDFYICRYELTQAEYEEVTGSNPSSFTGEYRETTVEIGSFFPNKFGLYDMHGNVSEWVWDYYGAYEPGEQTDPTGPAEESLRIYRGGGSSDTIFSAAAGPVLK